MVTANIDGGARGNPGPAGYGVRIEAADGTLLAELHGALGVATNNVAEYNGLLQPLYVRARLLVMELDRVEFEHVRREENKEADRLSNLAMDQSEATVRDPKGTRAP
jgi:probable phosphoglycerate mutase